MTDNTTSPSTAVIVIEPKKGWQVLNLRELFDNRDLLFFLVWRDIKVLYAQTILGFAWAILLPLIEITIYTIVFGKVAKLATDGVPYFLFATCAVVPWTYIAHATTVSSQSLVTGQGMLGKIYFPRMFFPLTPVAAKLIDFLIALFLVFVAMFFYDVTPTSNMFFLPLFIAMMVMIPMGAGLWLSAMAIRFRDVKHILPFVVRLLMYSAPIVYTASAIPDGYRFIYSLNPIVGTIEGFRACFLGTEIPWLYIVPGIATAILLVVSGAFYFRRMEKVFVDVI